MTDLRTIANAPRARFMALADEVAEAYQIDRADLLGNRRLRLWVDARQHLYLLAKERFGWSTTRIGNLTGRDHSTVVYGIQQDRARIARDLA
ncbi:helix-turn-helix domain-containing protein [Falsirhodobacter sp. 20TX0035]|uniref:helix-turn-helix domain-containing protein n=1 Tax=Falsirhodobacter sp. 20TX0035 TaxID=3022019 RepID=UPI002330F776|nr:helix-turn-helix domain-containing protein [Falsirhodobacter sp. 20TX0035]MDB6454991.1 helix-turn-helix domain-containing protein [Falsirhodobacter sp. 20TX0035]